jgi:hypothetical protein
MKENNGRSDSLRKKMEGMEIMPMDTPLTPEQKYNSDKQCSHDQLLLFLWNMNGAFSTSHSIKRALPAMSLNSAPGAGDRIKVAVIPKSATLSHDTSTEV